MSNADGLVNCLAGADSLAVVCHDDPDPDSLASALALAAIAEDAGVESIDILYGGEVSHQQNRVFVNLFEVELERVADADLDAYDRVAFVDHSVPGANNEVPPGTDVDVVVDHHPASTPVVAPFVDRREDVGATATILVEYLRDLDVEVTSRLASALLFALHRERVDFVRHPTVHEYDAARYVYPEADPSLLDELYGAAFTHSTLDAIGEAIRNREVRSSALVTGVGRTSERDALAQAADYLLNLEGVDTVLVHGLVGDAVTVSARSVDPRVDVGAVLAETFGDVGEAGGHQDMAGARLPLGIFADRGDDDADLQAFVARRVEGRFFDALDLEAGEQ